MKNKLIVFEGIDGVGKTTLAKLLRDNLIKLGFEAVLYEDLEEKNKGFNLIKPFIKEQVSINSSLFFYIASVIHKSQNINELLKKNFVICDRYIYSTIAYHVVRGADKSLINMKKLPIIWPDFLFLIKTQEKIRLERVKKRKKNNICDLKVKTNKNLIGKMEKELENFSPITINNSYNSPDIVSNTILNIILNSLL